MAEKKIHLQKNLIMQNGGVHYSDYLQLDKLLNAQDCESDKHKVEAHDEMLFIIIHQAYELWFKQILFEIDSIGEIMSKPVNDNSHGLQTVVHRQDRICTILKLLVQQIDVMETMTPMDFLDFRDLLRPASGFQSWQFKIMEAKLGLKYQNRFGQEYYISQLREEHRKLIRDVENAPSVLQLVNAWLERMPFFEETVNWKNFTAEFPTEKDLPVFWSEYRGIYEKSLVEGEKQNIKFFDEIFIHGGGEERSLSPKASRAAMFIMLYRGYPMMAFPFRLLNNLLEIDELLSTWRFRHMNMVHRIIGMRTGTGGSTGKEYLKGALDKHYIYKDLAALTSFLVERNKLPKLSVEMERRLGFN